MNAFNSSTTQSSHTYFNSNNNLEQGIHVDTQSSYNDFNPFQEVSSNQNSVIPAQYYCSNYWNVHNYNQLTCQNPYSSSSNPGTYLNGQQATPTSASSQGFAHADHHYGLANTADYSSPSSYNGAQSNHTVHLASPAEVAVAQSVSHLPTMASSAAAAAAVAGSNDNNLQRVSPIQYYSPSSSSSLQQQQQQALNPSSNIHHHQPNHALSDYYQFGASNSQQQQQQCDNYQPQVPVQQHVNAMLSSPSASSRPFTSPLYTANFNLDYTSLQHQLLFESSNSFEQPTAATQISMIQNGNGANQTSRSAALEMAPPPPPSQPNPGTDRCYGSSLASSRPANFASEAQQGQVNEQSAMKSGSGAKSNVSSTSQHHHVPQMVQNSITSMANKMEEIKKRHRQLFSVAQQQQNKCNKTEGSKAGQQQHYLSPSNNSSSSNSLGIISRRKNATRETTSTLKDWLDEHGQNPYPTKGEKIMLSIITKMSLTQVSTWFANARRRMKKESKVFWNSSANSNSTSSNNNNNNRCNNRTGSSALATSTAGLAAAANSNPCSQLVNKTGASSIRYFIQKHRKQLAGASSMLALSASSESRFSPVVYCGQTSSSLVQTTTAAATTTTPAPDNNNRRQLRLLATEADNNNNNTAETDQVDDESNKVNGANKRSTRMPSGAVHRHSSGLSSSSSSSPSSSSSSSSSSSATSSCCSSSSLAASSTSNLHQSSLSTTNSPTHISTTTAPKTANIDDKAKANKN